MLCRVFCCAMADCLSNVSVWEAGGKKVVLACCVGFPVKELVVSSVEEIVGECAMSWFYGQAFI